MCPHNVVNFGPLTSEIGLGVWDTPANFNGFRMLALLLQRRHCLKVNQTLHDVWPSAGMVHCSYIFGGSCPPLNFARCKIHIAYQVLHYPIFAALLHCTQTLGVRQNWRHGTMNGITKLYHRVPPIFGWAAITLGIGPHSTFLCLLWPPYAIRPAIIFLSCVSSSTFFVLAYSQPPLIGCLPYFHTWCGLSANSGCRSEMCCMRLAENTGRLKSPKNRNLCTITQLCRAISSQLEHVSTVRKQVVKQQCADHMSS